MFGPCCVFPLRSAYASRTKRGLRGRGPSHRDQNPSGKTEKSERKKRLGSRSPSARSTRQLGERGEHPPSGGRTEREILSAGKGRKGRKGRKEREREEGRAGSGFFGEGVGEEVEEGTEGAVVFGGAVGPGGVGEVVGAAGSETAVFFQAQELGLGMVAVVAFGDGFQAVAVPAGIEFVEVGSGDDFLELLDVVDDGFAQLFEHGTFGTPDAAVEAPLDLPLVEAGAHVEVEAGEVGGACAAAIGAEGGGEVVFEGGFVEGEAGIAIYAVGGILGSRGAEGGPPLADCGEEAVDVGEPEGAEVVVFGTVGLEPFAVLAAAELFKEAVEAGYVVGILHIFETEGHKKNYPSSRRIIFLP